MNSRGKKLITRYVLYLFTTTTQQVCVGIKYTVTLENMNLFFVLGKW